MKTAPAEAAGLEGATTPGEPGRLATAATRARVAGLSADQADAFWLGVAVGREEAAHHPDAIVLVFDPATLPSERERLRSLLGSLRGVAAALPAHHPTGIAR